MENSVKELFVAGVRMHDVPELSVQEVIQEISGRGCPQRIIFLRTFDVLRAWMSSRRRAELQEAGLVIPVQRGVQVLAALAGFSRPQRYMPFQFVVKVLGAIEQQQGSIYLVGGRPATLERAEGNVRYTFPNLRIVGRYPGYVKKGMQAALLTAARKSSPDVLLIGSGTAGRSPGFLRKTENLPNGICISAPKVFLVFAQKRKRPSQFLFNTSLGGVFASLLLPWHWVRFPFYAVFGIRLLGQRLSARKK